MTNVVGRTGERFECPEQTSGCITVCEASSAELAAERIAPRVLKSIVALESKVRFTGLIGAGVANHLAQIGRAP
jgi:hypothetical protein